MSRIKLYRVADPGQHAVVHPDSGIYTVPDPRKPFREDDPLVIHYPWLFMADEDNIERPVESATRAPGEKRITPPLPRDR